MIGEAVPLVLGVRPRGQRAAEHLMIAYFRWRWGVSDILCGMKGYTIDTYAAHGTFSRSDSIGTELAWSALRLKIPFHQIDVVGRPRIDLPRFDGRLKANARILAALWRVVKADWSGR